MVQRDQETINAKEEGKACHILESTDKRSEE